MNIGRCKVSHGNVWQSPRKVHAVKGQHGPTVTVGNMAGKPFPLDMKKSTKQLSLFTAIILCGCQSKPTDQIISLGETTFARNEKVYKVSNNEVFEIADFSKQNIRKLDASSSRLKNLPDDSLNFIHPGAYASLSTVYRGNTLFYKLTVYGLNDLKSNYSYGGFTLILQDQDEFQLFTEELAANKLVGIVDASGQIQHYEANGKFETSQDLNDAVVSFTLSSTFKRK